MTRNAEASGWPGSRAASAAATSADSVWPRVTAMRPSAVQNGSSRATLVRWPAREKLRFTSPVSLHLLPVMRLPGWSWQGQPSDRSPRGR